MGLMTRRHFLKTIVRGVASASFPIHSSVPSLISKSRPNVLFIGVDDLNNWTGCLGGHTDAKTPNIDRLAKSGVLFTNAHCSAPICNSSRTSLMTGILPSTSGVYTNKEPWRPVLPNAVTIPQYFMAQGYRVVGAGKIEHPEYQELRSWNDYLPTPEETYLPPHQPVNGFGDELPYKGFDWEPLDVKDSDMADWKITEWVVRELKKKHDKPFFLACGINKPHLPWYVPRGYFDMYPPDKIALPRVKEDDLEDVPPLGRDLALAFGEHKRVLEHNQWKKAVSGYLASISFADICVGRVIEALYKSPYANRTIVILWSDYSFHIGEKSHWGKVTLWEESTHIPLIIVAPGVTKAGGICRRPVSLLDIYHTPADLRGLEERRDLEGNSLVPLLKNPEGKSERPTLTTLRRNNHSIRSERWQYIRYSDGTEELYDHETDKLEWNNLAGKPEYFGIKKELARWLPKFNAEEAPERRVYRRMERKRERSIRREESGTKKD